jgi:hypothetical protein
MPIKKCQENKEPGYKWGDAGKCYIYNPKDEQSIKDAKKKAVAQGIAIGDIELSELSKIKSRMNADTQKKTSETL